MTTPSIIKVLLVDDHNIVRDGLQSILKPHAESIQVAGEAATGKEAIALLENAASAQPADVVQRAEVVQRIDVVLMDISMPEMTGLEATRYIRQHFPGVKVLLLTMLDQPELILEAIEAGAQGYVLKTAGHKEIIHAIRTVYEGEEYFSTDVAKLLIRSVRASRSRTGWAGGPASVSSSRDSLSDQAATGYPANADSFSATAQSAELNKLPNEITPRELEVLQLIAEGYTTITISERLFTSRRTIETHRQNLLTKTGCNNTASLIRFAVQHGLVD